MLDWIALVFIATCCWWFSRTRLLHNLRFFQQEDYNPRRYLSWVWQHHFFDRKGTLLALIAAFIIYLTSSFTLSMVFASLFVIRTAFEEDPRTQGKLRLKMTERAKQLYNTALVMQALLGGASVMLALLLSSVTYLWVFEAVLMQLIPLTIVLAHLFNWPAEKQKQMRFEEEARDLLQEVNPYIIGITGSYGKTSTKEALGEILQVALGATFWPPKGINTIMGATREIRERLQKGYRYAVFEMGAYGRGSIQRLCDFAPPQAAIITAIGTAHLERFGSKENIYLTKSELAQALPENGTLVCNGDDEGARKIALENPKKVTLLYGFDKKAGPLDCWISDYKTTLQGTEFTFEWKGLSYQGKTPLLGKPAISNLAGAFTMACALDADPYLVIAALANLQPVDNRLKLQKTESVSYLHDAYNSNPIGFEAALNVLKELPFKRKIVMTPGMIELGEIQTAENESLGRKASCICDMALVVGKTNQAAFVKGLKEGGLAEDRIHLCLSREEAFQMLKNLQSDGDLVLIENDLPDLYERIPCL